VRLMATSKQTMFAMVGAVAYAVLVVAAAPFHVAAFIVDGVAVVAVAAVVAAVGNSCLISVMIPAAGRPQQSDGV